MTTYYIQRQDIHQAVVDASSEEEAHEIAQNNPAAWYLLSVSDNEIVDEQ